MPQITKPNTLNKIWADGGDKATPLDSKINSGWQIEIPPRQWFNWLDNRQDQAIAHINQHGIAVWDNVTEYQANKSYVQDPSNGVIYRCLATNVGNLPSSSPTFWTVAFADAASAFSEGQADAKYLAKSQNLNDLPNKTQARANLGVYSTAQVDSKVASAPSIGVGQTWTNVTSSRGWNTTYTNNTGKPIQVVISVNDNGNSSGWNFSVGGVQVVVGANLGAGWQGLVNVIVPAGQTYRLSITSGTGHPILGWSELR